MTFRKTSVLAEQAPDAGSFRPNRPKTGAVDAWFRRPRKPFRYFNNSPEIIRLTVMLYIRYPLSLLQVEDLPFEHSIDIDNETMRFRWTFQPMFAGGSASAGFIIARSRTGAGAWPKCSRRSMARRIISAN